MADQLLNAVIRLENQIQRQLQQETIRAEAWLAGVRAELQRRLEQAEQEFAAQHDQALKKARENAAEVADALVADEMFCCSRLEELSDADLLEVLERQLVPRLLNTDD